MRIKIREYTVKGNCAFCRLAAVVYTARNTPCGTRRLVWTAKLSGMYSCSSDNRLYTVIAKTKVGVKRHEQPVGLRDVRKEMSSDVNTSSASCSAITFYERYVTAKTRTAVNLIAERFLFSSYSHKFTRRSVLPALYSEQYRIT